MCTVAAVLVGMVNLAFNSPESAAKRAPIPMRFEEAMKGKREGSGDNTFCEDDRANRLVSEKFAKEWKGRKQTFVDRVQAKLADEDSMPAAAVLGEIANISPSSAAAVCLQMDGDAALDLLVCMRAQRYEDAALLREMKEGSAERLDELSAERLEQLLKKKQQDWMLRNSKNLLGPELKDGDQVLYQGVQHNFYSVAKGVTFPSPNWDAPQTLINVSFVCVCVCFCAHAVTCSTRRISDHRALSSQINMMPINMADINSLPENLRGYWPVC